nr:MAG: hypothetical protein 3 [Leviviridae sp.]
MKNVDMVMQPYCLICKDVAAWRHDLKPDLDRSLDRLRNTLKTRGYGVVLLDLPRLGKLIDKGLSSGYLRKEDIPHSLGSFVKGTLLFHGLISGLFGEEGDLDDEADPTLVFFVRQLCYVLKKLEIDCPKQAIEDAVQDFFLLDSTLREPTLGWHCHPEYWAALIELGVPKDLSFTDAIPGRRDLFPGTVVHKHFSLLRALRLLDDVTRYMFCRIPPIEHGDFIPRHGPGAVADLKTGGDKHTFPVWPDRLDYWFPKSIYSEYSEERFRDNDHSGQLIPKEPMAKLHAVPKDYKGPRLITAEPTACQYIQQGVLRHLRLHMPRLLKHCYAFDSQEPSRAAAKNACDDGMATVDLSSASDRLSLWTVERAFRHSAILPFLYASRCLQVVDATGSIEVYPHILKKYAGQGNATTFPVQSFIYACIGIAAVLASEGEDASKSNIEDAARRVRVFGDDIIVPELCLNHLALILQHLQLKINGDKTHFGGFFRESCGMDAFKGKDVTPVYMHHLEPGSEAASIVSWCDVSNNAHRKGLWRFAEGLKEKLPKKFLLRVPTTGRQLPCITLHTFSPGLDYHGSERWSSTLHRHEIKGLVPFARTKIKRREDGNDLLEYFIRQSTLRYTFLDYLKATSRLETGIVSVPSLKLKARWVGKDS